MNKREAGQEDIGQPLTVENERGALSFGVVKALISTGVWMSVQYIDTGNDGWEMLSPPELRLIRGAQVVSGLLPG